MSGYDCQMTGPRIEGVKVFSATKAREREALGDKVTEWLRSNPGIEIVEKSVTLSSDREFHCFSIVLFWTSDLGARAEGGTDDAGK
jgi:hypothetical protein